MGHTVAAICPSPFRVKISEGAEQMSQTRCVEPLQFQITVSTNLDTFGRRSLVGDRVRVQTAKNSSEAFPRRGSAPPEAERRRSHAPSVVSSPALPPRLVQAGLRRKGPEGGDDVSRRRHRGSGCEGSSAAVAAVSRPDTSSLTALPLELEKEGLRSRSCSIFWARGGAGEGSEGRR